MSEPKSSRCWSVSCGTTRYADTQSWLWESSLPLRFEQMLNRSCIIPSSGYERKRRRRSRTSTRQRAAQVEMSVNLAAEEDAGLVGESCVADGCMTLACPDRTTVCLNPRGAGSSGDTRAREAELEPLRKIAIGSFPVIHHRQLSCRGDWVWPTVDSMDQWSIAPLTF